MLTWRDGSVQRCITLTKAKGKPSICNPLLGLATVLSWARELPASILPGGKLPHLPENLGRARGADAGTLPGHTLSVGAAWMLAHIVFGSNAGVGPTEQSLGERRAPRGEVLVTGGEAAALSLLSCPGIGWAPEPEVVMRALLEGGGTICAYTASACGSDVTQGQWGSEARAACEELVVAGLCKRSPDQGRLALLPDVRT